MNSLLPGEKGDHLHLSVRRYQSTLELQQGGGDVWSIPQPHGCPGRLSGTCIVVRYLPRAREMDGMSTNSCPPWSWMKLRFLEQLVSYICSVSLGGERKISSGIGSPRIHVHEKMEGGVFGAISITRPNAPGLTLG